MQYNSILLDTNFIISCIKKKIDFLEALQNKGLRIIIPKQVIQELENIHLSKQSITQRNNAHLTLEILKNRKNEFQAIDLKEKYVDKGILEYIKAHPQTKVATLDKMLKDKLKKLRIQIVLLKSGGKIEF